MDTSDSFTRIKKVKDNLASWQENWGNEFSYLASGFFSENAEDFEPKELVSPKQHENILKYLATKGFLEIVSEKANSFRIKILPKPTPFVKLKTLELIARELKDHYTGTTIDSFLKECGVNQRFIVPDSKWAIFYKVFEELAVSKSKADKDLLFKIIADSIHPLNLGGDQEKSDRLIKKFNDYLKYDNLEISYSVLSKSFVIVESRDAQFTDNHLTIEEQRQILLDEIEEQEKEEIAILKNPKAIEAISVLRKCYQTLMNLVEIL